MNTHIQDLARQALDAEILHDRPGFEQAMMNIYAVDGPAGIMQAMFAWADILWDHVSDDRPVMNLEPMSFYGTSSRTVRQGDDPEIPPHIRWAGQWLHAYFQHDKAVLDHLMLELPEDFERLGACIWAVCHLVEQSLMHLPRGCAHRS